MLAAIFYLLLLVCLLAGLAILFVNMPGLWLMVLAAMVYAIITPPLEWHRMKMLFVLMGLALVAEVIDFFAAGAGAKRAGGTRRGLWGAIIGGIVGAIVGSIVLPVLLTLVGVCIGTFLGAFFGEVSGGKEIGQSVRIGAHATAGRLAGTVLKLAFGCVMLVITMWWAWPSRTHAAAVIAAPPARTIVLPATTQAS